jgi:hypothetical protein
LTNTRIYDLVVSEGNVFAATLGGGVFLSTDTGAQWTAVNTGLTSDRILSLAVSGTDLFAGATGGAFLSTNNGASWTLVDEGLTDRAVWSIAVSGTNLFAGTTWGGVFHSTNRGTSWNAVNAGLLYNHINTLSATGTDVFAGTEGGVWRCPISDLNSVGQPSHGMPLHCALAQNFPNPFNPSTTIRYGLPSRSHVTLTVFNVLGQQVSTLVDGEREAGFHEVSFDASGLASGVYLYRLQAGSFVESRKLAVVR